MKIFLPSGFLWAWCLFSSLVPKERSQDCWRSHTNHCLDPCTIDDIPIKYHIMIWLLFHTYMLAFCNIWYPLKLHHVDSYPQNTFICVHGVHCLLRVCRSALTDLSRHVGMRINDLKSTFNIILYLHGIFHHYIFPLFQNSWQRIPIPNEISCKILTLYIPPSRATSVSSMEILFQSHFRYYSFAVLFIKNSLINFQR